MKNLFEIAVYIVSESREKGYDPMDVGSKIARQFKLCSSDAETLFMEIWLVQRFGVDEPHRVEKSKKTLPASILENIASATA